MINGKKVVVVLPAYNAEKTLRATFNEIPFDIVDEAILVDDCSYDGTSALAEKLGVHHVIVHQENKGYGGNQKTCYNKALAIGAEIVVMLHPDYQYTPKLIHSMCYLIGNGVYPVVLGSRILGNGALKGGMPLYKYCFNRCLTLFQNLLMNQKLSEYHTGFRAFSSEVLNSINYNCNSDNFVFDNQMLAQICHNGFPIGEISCPTKYDTDSSSIGFRRSIVYGMGVLGTTLRYFLSKTLRIRSSLFKPVGH